IRYAPAPSVTTVRTFSIRAGLAASTVTPGKNAPDVSLTVPAMLPVAACAQRAAGTKRRPDSTNAIDRRRVMARSAKKLWTRLDQWGPGGRNSARPLLRCQE